MTIVSSEPLDVNGTAQFDDGGLPWNEALTAAIHEVVREDCVAVVSADLPRVTAEDIRRNAGGRKINYWIVNDSCPPSPGCTVSRKDLLPESSGLSFADVWQFSQSPKRTDFASGCSATCLKTLQSFNGTPTDLICRPVQLGLLHPSIT